MSGSAQLTPPEAGMDVCFPGPSLADVTSPHHLLVREHFDHYAQFIDPNTPQSISTRAFHLLVNGNGPALLFSNLGYEQPRVEGKRWVQGKQPIPYNGIVIVRRDTFGIPEYQTAAKNTAILARYAVVAGSLLHVAEADPYLTSPYYSTYTSLALRDIVAYLREQIKP